MPDKSRHRGHYSRCRDCFTCMCLFSVRVVKRAQCTTLFNVDLERDAHKVPASRVERAGGGDGCQDIRWARCARPSAAVRVTRQGRVPSACITFFGSCNYPKWKEPGRLCSVFHQGRFDFYRFTPNLYCTRVHFYRFTPKAAHFYRTPTLWCQVPRPQEPLNSSEGPRFALIVHFTSL